MDRISGEERRPTVSALVTTFNHEGYIGAALESLLSQTRALDEILVVDDGSSDATPGVVSSFERFGVTLLRTPNHGPSRAMNMLLRRARGAVLSLQSGDDVSHPDRIAAQLDQLGSSDVVCCTPQLIDAAGVDLPPEALPVFSSVAPAFDGLGLFFQLFFAGNFICAPTVAMHRKVVETTGLFHEGLIQLQDHHYWLRAAAHGFRFAVSSRAYASYRVHPLNLSRPANDHRTLVELPYVLRTAVAALGQDQLTTLLYGEGFRCRRLPSTAPLRALLFLRHSRPEVRRLGLELLMDELADDGGRERLADGLGLQPSAIFALMSVA